ncbi:FAD-dependent oxidoreductase [Chloroflexia bacterium SDU3-3]|nr:FAD-dependent oxidoreductase [Chloroflexia bacterium SDU3-3]
MSDLRDRIAALSPEQRAQLLTQLQGKKAPSDSLPGTYDVAILGGGIAGLTLALQLKLQRPSIRVALIEKQRHPVPEAAHKVGESTVEIAAHYLRDILGFDEHLQSQQLRKFGLRMFFSAEDNRDIARRVELGSTVFPPLHTYQVDRGRLENALGERIAAEQGIDFLHGFKVKQIALRPESETHLLKIADEAEQEQEIEARWVVDSTGRSSLLKRQLGLGKKVRHHANSAWFRIAHPLDIKQWTDDPAWQARVSMGDRSLSTNHLMGNGYWVWIIRLASGSTSIGIVADAEMHPFEGFNRFDRALEWLREREPQLAAILDQQREQLQDFRVMKDYSYSCEQAYSADRWCLTGEAGVALDPLYSPGSDLIAISNGLVCDLVTRALRGEDVQARAMVHDKLFLNLANLWLGIYEQQYTLMDNPQIMITKIIWDTAFYWGVFGLLYFHDAFRSIADNPGVATSLARISTLSNRVQAFFREWHAIDQPEITDAFVDLYGPLEFMAKLHTGMAAGLAPAQLDAQFAENVRFFERLAGQIISMVIEETADHPEQAGAMAQIQRWQTDPYVAELIARYRRESRAHPINSSWIALKYQLRERQEVLQ